MLRDECLASHECLLFRGRRPALSELALLLRVVFLNLHDDVGVVLGCLAFHCIWQVLDGL